MIQSAFHCNLPLDQFGQAPNLSGYVNFNQSQQMNSYVPTRPKNFNAQNANFKGI